MDRSTFSSSLAPMRGSTRSFCSRHSRSSSSMVPTLIVLEQQGDALRPEALDLEELERGRRELLQQQIAALAGAVVHDLCEHHGQPFADAGDIGDLALRVA